MIKIKQQYHLTRSKLITHVKPHTQATHEFKFQCEIHKYSMLMHVHLG